MDKRTWHEAAIKDRCAIGEFASAMALKLDSVRQVRGYNWELCPTDYLQNMLVDCVAKGDPVDVANLAMMLHARGEQSVLNRTVASAAKQAGEVIPGFKREDLQDVLEGMETEDQTIDVGAAMIESTAGYVCRLIRALLAAPISEDTGAGNTTLQAIEEKLREAQAEGDDWTATQALNWLSKRIAEIKKVAPPASIDARSAQTNRGGK